jgi:hypothetical protein
MSVSALTGARAGSTWVQVAIRFLGEAVKSVVVKDRGVVGSGRGMGRGRRVIVYSGDC